MGSRWDSPLYGSGSASGSALHSPLPVESRWHTQAGTGSLCEDTALQTVAESVPLNTQPIESTEILSTEILSTEIPSTEILSTEILSTAVRVVAATEGSGQQELLRPAGSWRGTRHVLFEVFVHQSFYVTAKRAFNHSARTHRSTMHLHSTELLGIQLAAVGSTSKSLATKGEAPQ